MKKDNKTNSHPLPSESFMNIIKKYIIDDDLIITTDSSIKES